MSDKTGGPAYPVVFDDAVGADCSVEKGMTLRDYFAAKAMQAIVIGNNADQCVMGAGCAADAYALADAMLKERAK